MHNCAFLTPNLIFYNSRSLSVSIWSSKWLAWLAWLAWGKQSIGTLRPNARVYSEMGKSSRKIVFSQISISRGKLSEISRKSLQAMKEILLIAENPTWSCNICSFKPKTSFYREITLSEWKLINKSKKISFCETY